MRTPRIAARVACCLIAGLLVPACLATCLLLAQQAMDYPAKTGTTTTE